MKDEFLENRFHINRRHFLGKLSLGIGSAALGSLLIPDLFSSDPESLAIPGLPQFAPKAKRIIYLFQNGAPSQLESFDYKPLLNQMAGKDLPESVRTEAINHDPALNFMQTGAQQENRPSMGAWLSYGLGSENKNLPAFYVLLSKGKGNGQGVYSKLWSNGFLPSIHQGVQFSSGENPVLYLNNPDGIDKADRRRMLDKLD